MPDIMKLPSNTKKQSPISTFEQTCLTAVMLCREDAYGMKVHRKVEELAERSIQLPMVYLALDRLEERGYVESWMGDPTPERGGRGKRYFKVLPAGELAMTEVAKAAKRILKPWGLLKWLR